MEVRGFERGYSFRLLLLHLGCVVDGCGCRACKAGESFASGILFGEFFRRSCSTGERLTRLSLRRLEPYLDQEALAMIGAALAFDAIYGRAGVFSLKALLECRLIVAQSGAGTQLLC